MARFMSGIKFLTFAKGCIVSALLEHACTSLKFFVYGYLKTLHHLWQYLYAIYLHEDILLRFQKCLHENESQNCVSVVSIQSPPCSFADGLYCQGILEAFKPLEKGLFLNESRVSGASQLLDLVPILWVSIGICCAAMFLCYFVCVIWMIVDRLWCFSGGRRSPWSGKYVNCNHSAVSHIPELGR